MWQQDRHTGRPWVLIMETACSFITTCLALFQICSCKPVTSQQSPTPAEVVWHKAEYEYRTNTAIRAYVLTLDARNELLRLQLVRPNDLNYDYCLARLNARLFLTARSLGYTNEAATFLRDSVYRFQKERTKLGLGVTNYSVERIEAIMAEWDAKMHSNEARQSHH